MSRAMTAGAEIDLGLQALVAVEHLNVGHLDSGSFNLQRKQSIQ